MQIDSPNEPLVDTEVGHLLPRYMDYEYAQMFDATIRDRKEYATFVNKNIPELEASVNTIVSTHNNESTVSWVGGSRAWKSVYDRYFSSQPLDEIATASIRSAGNFDVFMIHNDASSYKALLDDVNDAVKAIHWELTKNSVLIDNYSVNLVYPKGKIPGRGKPLNKDLQMCALFPCMSIAIELTSRPSPRRKTTSSFPELNEKLLVYVEVIYLKRINIPLFKRQLFDSQKKLSPIGLLFFSNFLTNSRANKTLNIDAYRTRFMERMITASGDTWARVYHQIAVTYHQVFSVNFGVKSLDTIFVQNAYLKAVVALHEKTHKYNIVDYYTYVLMEKLRPAINSCLIYIAAFLKSKFDAFNAHLVVVGGDAMRRYIPDVAATADIDTKVYYKKGKAKIFDKLLALMVLMVTVLENNYEFDKKDVYKITENVNVFEGSGSYTVELPKIQLLGYEDTDDVMSVSSVSSRGSESLIGDEFNNNIFRLRIIEESSEFPVTLFSIDASIPIRVEIKGQVMYETKLIIPVFDLVMQYKEDTIAAADIRDTKHAIPIASMSFLINDLRSTYTDESKAQMRFFGFKKDKDEKRLKKLQALLRTSPSTYYDTLDRVRLAQAGFVTDDGKSLREDIHNDMVEYRCKFKNMISVNRRGKMLKHKMPFSRIKMEKIRKKCDIGFDWNQEILKHIDLRLGLMEFDYKRGMSTVTSSGGGKKKEGAKKTKGLRKRAKDYIVKKYGESCMKRKDTLALDRYLCEFMVHEAS